MPETNPALYDAASIQCELRDAAKTLSQLCLYQGAKWLAEALTSMDIPPSKSSVPNKRLFSTQYFQLEQQLQEEDTLLLAKACFDCKEFRRCQHLLRSARSPRGVFLRLYAQYLDGEKRREEDSEGVLGFLDNLSTNQELPKILEELDEYLSSTDASDPFINYLKGVVLLKQKNEKAALHHLVISVQRFPYNWSAWLEILACISDVDQVSELLQRLPDHIMTAMFELVAYQEAFSKSEVLEKNLSLMDVLFPHFQFITLQRALLSYHNLDYPESETFFNEILQKDPYRLDEMDVYSNILYVMEKQSQLSYLAQIASSTDKFRAETCCIVANYYSLRSEHEKAIMYYRRALTINRSCLSAWTLMGHEFVELKNSHAAIESYRRAVDANKKDFRAWYGLGQAYEVLDMQYYSLYYYQRAAALKPLDMRMWQAVAHCYENLQRYDEAIKACLRALQVSDSDPVILYKLGMLNDKHGSKKDAYKYMKICLDQEEVEGVSDETVKARLWLARYEAKLGNWEAVFNYSNDLVHGTPNEIEEARALSRQARSSFNHQS